MKRLVQGLGILLVVSPAAAAPGQPFSVADIARIADVTAPAFAPDGESLVYTVTRANLDADEPQSDIWRVNWDGTDARALTFTAEASEWQPAPSPDSRSIAFLSDRGSDDAVTQVWIMASTGGEARPATDFPGGVQDFVWSPDSQRLAVIARDALPEPEDDDRPPPPIVIDRFQFKEDFTGYLTARRQHLYLQDIGADTPAVQLTSGDHDEYLPSWSPDGQTIAFVTKRGDRADRTFNYDIYLIAARAGARERQLTTFPGSDLDPYWETRPAFSPDGRQIAYLQSGEDKWIYYAPWQLAIVDVETGKSRIPAPIDRCFYKPRWSPDGRSVLALIEENRVTHLARIDVRTGKVTSLTSGARFEYDFAIAPAKDRIAVLGGTDLRPYEIAAVERRGLRALTNQNAFLDDRRIQPSEDIEFESADGTRIEGLLMKPVDYVPGRRYPTVLRLHGGPAYQFSHEFMADWQVYAAHGYAVVAPNPRGSSGRGFEFARAIYADWGNVDVADSLAAVEHAIELGIADPDRLVVGGRSYGGMLTNYVIASDTRFKAAVSGAGVSNMYGSYGADQYTREYEFELGTPWKNRDAYDRVSYPFLHADRIETPTLFYCAEKDMNVPCIGSEQMYQALRSLDVPTELVIYPGEYHPITVPSYLLDRMQRHLDWYEVHLGKR
jgi:dipeptidyl aminopeptidase/acylaminoacyl peptidase